MDFKDLSKQFTDAGQDHVFRYWNELNPQSKHDFVAQLESVDLSLIDRFRSILQSSQVKQPHGNMEPPEVIRLPKTPGEIKAFSEAKEIGEQAIRNGEVGVFLVAGGQGTRLGFDGPKGCFPCTPVKHKTLFQLHAEKILAASRAFQTAIPWYIMTSEMNDEATRRFFEENRFFGLNPSDVFFIRQKMLPVLDQNGKLILDAKDHLAVSPNGHGGAFLAMQDGGVLEDCRKRGIKTLSYFQVDNVLIHIIDPVFIGFHVQARGQMSSKMTLKRDAHEKVGHFGLIDGRLKVVEYSDLTEAEMTATNPDGSLKYGAGSIGIHLIHPEFVEEQLEGGLKLPYHVAHKKIPFLDKSGTLITPESPNGYKFETFIFDAVYNTERSIILEVKREEDFSPIKNHSGEDSPKTARRAMNNFYGSWFEAKGFSISRDAQGEVVHNLEISPLFARTKEDFLRIDFPSKNFDGPFYFGPE